MRTTRTAPPWWRASWLVALLTGMCGAPGGAVADPASAPTPAIESPGWLDRLLTRLGAADKVDVSHGVDWGVMPGPFYNPEMGFGVGAAAIGLYRTPDALDTTQLSTLTLHGLLTTTGAFGIGADNTTFFGNDAFRFLFSGAAINMPTQYWGVGYERAGDDALTSNVVVVALANKMARTIWAILAHGGRTRKST